MSFVTDEERAARDSRPQHIWTFLSNHCHVLVLLYKEPFARLRDVARDVGITERAVQRIVKDLEDAKVIVKSKQGRRNRYAINTKRRLRHQIESHRTIGELLELLAK